MGKECTNNSYEEARKQRLEENKKKFEGLGISKIAKNLTEVTTPVKKTRRQLPKSKSKTDDLVEPRRSSRARNPIASYSEEAGIDLPTMRKRSRSNSSGCYSYIARPLDEIKQASDRQRSRAWEAAEELQANLQSKNPTFIKSMVRSHVYSCFWLGLPSKFCEEHLPKTHYNMILEDENGSEYEAVYIGSRAGLSGGWRAFALEHKLDDGDALVFELIEPARFKIYTVKAFPDSVEEDKTVNSEEKGSNRETKSKKTKKQKRATVHETNVSESSHEHLPQNSIDNDVKAKELSPSKLLAAGESKVEAQVKSVKPKGKNLVKPQGAKPSKKQKTTKDLVHDAGELMDVGASKVEAQVKSVKPKGKNLVKPQGAKPSEKQKATKNVDDAGELMDVGALKVETQVKIVKPKGKNRVIPQGTKPSKKYKITENLVHDAGGVEPVAEAIKDDSHTESLKPNNTVNTQGSNQNKTPEATDNIVQDAVELQEVKPVEEARKCVSQKPRKRAPGKLFRKRA